MLVHIRIHIFRFIQHINREGKWCGEVGEKDLRSKNSTAQNGMVICAKQCCKFTAHGVRHDDSIMESVEFNEITHSLLPAMLWDMHQKAGHTLLQGDERVVKATSNGVYTVNCIV